MSHNMNMSRWVLFLVFLTSPGNNYKVLTESANGHECFETREDLLNAVDAYLDSPQRTEVYESKYGTPIGSWCVNKITDFSELFHSDRNKNAESFNEDLDSWDVSAAFTMKKMFTKAKLFNQQLWSWDTSQVENMAGMFAGAEMFAQDLAMWNTSNVKHMENMFSHGDQDQAVYSFNHDISKWDVSNVRNMKAMFAGSTVFNQNLNLWDVSRVENMKSMFQDCTAFAGDVSTWDTGNVGDMRNMFHGASKFNMDVSKWNTEKVIHMSYMFSEAKIFNQDIGNWDIMKVFSFDHMFDGAIQFKENLCPWAAQIGIASANQSGKKTFEGMFANTNCPNPADPDIGSILSNFCYDQCEGKVERTAPPQPQNTVIETTLEPQPEQQAEQSTTTTAEQSTTTTAEAPPTAATEPPTQQQAAQKEEKKENKGKKHGANAMAALGYFFLAMLFSGLFMLVRKQLRNAHSGIDMSYNQGLSMEDDNVQMRRIQSHSSERHHAEQVQVYDMSSNHSCSNEDVSAVFQDEPGGGGKYEDDSNEQEAMERSQRSERSDQYKYKGPTASIHPPEEEHEHATGPMTDLTPGPPPTVSLEDYNDAGYVDHGEENAII